MEFNSISVLPRVRILQVSVPAPTPPHLEPNPIQQHVLLWLKTKKTTVGKAWPLETDSPGLDSKLCHILYDLEQITSLF